MFTSLELKAAGLVALLIAVCVGLYAYDSHEQALGAASLRADVAEAGASQAISSAAKSATTLAATQETAHVAQSQLAAASVAAAGADRQRDALLLQLAILRRRAVPGDPAASSAGTSLDGGDPIGVLADVLGRSDARASIVDRLADERRIRAEACERSYDALTNP